MANAIALLEKIILPRKVQFNFSVLLSGSYVSSNATVGVAGETLNFNAASNTKKLSRPKIPNGPPGSRLPVNTEVEVLNSVGGFTAVVEQNLVSPTAANFVMRLYTSGGTEMTAQAYNTSAPLLLTVPFVVQVTVPSKYN